MKNPLPAQELQAMIGNHGFLRLYGQDSYLYVSDVPRRVSPEILTRILHTMREQGFSGQISPANLLLIDFQPSRWKEYLDSFRDTRSVPFPHEDRLVDVYALIRLLAIHSSAFERQPMEPVRTVLKRYGERDGIPALAPRLLAQCAQRIRDHAPLPAALINILVLWLQEQ